ncbi:SMP-30/gluconolactonase/LRE family protein [Paenibacillus filicis]|uniref:SMP-30/gluconolactonase/LRE family protein n=1 Tax=Paenibacillus gyeongsangnamensis TaxID=3388067 RepID=A0ABT4QFD9_9BACL|nr:SMP-30/gluconolactonase/LRE family protein [Paenibacillus filicis]MCZ8515595.1 SMP-30/gluconolactonase/LRE family protein [Paenibacillus filicis]
MRSKKLHKPFLLALATFVLLLALAPAGAWAFVPYDTNYKDNYGRLVWTQSAYNPVDVLGREIYIPDPKDPSKQVFSPLVQPKDLFINDKDEIFIADTGNNRIVQLDPAGNLIRIMDVKESPLKKPEGLFIDGKGDIYVADTGNKRVVRLDKNGKLIKEFKRPDSKFLPESFKYDPIKLVVDKRGFLYIATLGGYQGLLQLDPEGNFQSFFGANKTDFSVMDAIKRVLYTREMYLREISKLPGSVASVTIDKNGLIYTVTKDIPKGQIKKLNMAGKDLLAAKDEYTDKVETKNYGEIRFPPKDKNAKPQLNDLTVDGDGNITAVDATLKYVNQYDASGNLLFYWGGDVAASTSKLGVVKTPSAIAANSKNELFILDEENNAVQMFRLSEFGAMVHKANQLTQEGKYEESEKPWEEVLRLNSFYTPAVLGLAKAAYKKGDYERAEKLFLEAGFAQGYSDAYWQIRLRWFQQHFGTLMNIVLIGGIGLYLLNRLTKKTEWRRRWRERERSKIPMVVQLKHAFYILKHPIDGFTAIRYEGKGSLWSSLIMLVLAIASFAVMRAGTSFTFNPSVVLDLNLFTVIVQFLVVWVGWVISNYLISTIYRGEGRFRDVVYGSTYALFPFVIVGLPLTLISNVMTLSEQSIYNFLSTGLMVWVAALIFWKVQAMQNYSVGESAMNIFLSLLTMTMLGVLIFITFGLSNELKDFFYSIYQEVTIR